MMILVLRLSLQAPPRQRARQGDPLPLAAGELHVADHGVVAVREGLRRRREMQDISPPLTICVYLKSMSLFSLT